MDLGLDAFLFEAELDDHHQVMLHVGRALNPSPLVWLVTKCIGNYVQFTRGRE